MNKWIGIAALLLFGWILICWNWYVCGIKGLCETDQVVETKQDSSIMIAPDEVDLDARPTTEAPFTSQQNVTITETEVVVRCETYLKTYIKDGTNNSSADVSRLETYLNTYENEDLAVDGIFGQDDKQAVQRFQAKYSSVVLEPWGITEPTGYVFQTTRDHINRLYCAQTGR